MVGRRTRELWQGSDEVGYGVVLVLIAITYAASVTARSTTWTAIVLLLQTAVLVIVLRMSHARRVVRLVAYSVMLVALVVAVVAVTTRPESHAGRVGQSPALVVLLVVSALLYGIAPLSILRHQLTRPTIDTQTLLAAIASYVLLGMFFAFTYRAIAEVQTRPFFGTGGPGSVSDDLFFSFVTLTTTGYGNLVPVGNPGQTFAVLEAILGQLFLVTAVAKIVNESGLLSSRTQRNRAAAIESGQPLSAARIAPPDVASGSDPAAEPQPS